ncbi:Alpha-tocopherol transfer protein-like [Armadillidium nasatum]|uniref:Alpha-tocopherol transfer protein-like n=1 Tax=Armadillidium nasatum TaxID=96803 RepID=A0A5N5T4C4_9CRUS|nr:Alpha-tocopherol transfer protein-like [Armadillidium nasatum]
MINPFDLSPELLKIAKEELHEDPERRQKDIEYIREWLQKQSSYHCQNREFLPLPGYDEKGRKVILIRPDLHDTNTTSMDDVLKVEQIILDLLIEEDLQHSLIGVIVLLDFHDFTPNNALQMTPFIFKKIFTVWQEAYPIRLKAIHVIKAPPTFQVILNLMKQFMKEKLKQRLHVHGNDMESLFDHIAQSILPKEYGGGNGNLKEITEYWHKKANEKRKLAFGGREIQS